jgi:TPR repeat protein
MNTRDLFFILAFLAASAAHAAPAETSCTPQAVAALESQAAQGDSRAQYWLGTQLEMGECGTKDPQRANSLLQQSAAKNFPPAVHVLGVILRRDAKDAEALKYFERSANLGFQHGFADMGFTYGLRDSPVRDAVLSYAWFTVAIARETKAPLREYLTSSRAKVESAMSASDLARAKAVAAELTAKFSSVPVWADNQ